MKRSVYLKSLFDKFNAGKISEEAYDAGVMNADAFCDDDDDEEGDY